MENSDRVRWVLSLLESAGSQGSNEEIEAFIKTGPECIATFMHAAEQAPSEEILRPCLVLIGSVVHRYRDTIVEFEWFQSWLLALTEKYASHNGLVAHIVHLFEFFRDMNTDTFMNLFSLGVNSDDYLRFSLNFGSVLYYDSRDEEWTRRFLECTCNLLCKSIVPDQQDLEILQDSIDLLGILGLYDRPKFMSFIESICSNDFARWRECPEVWLLLNDAIPFDFACPQLMLAMEMMQSPELPLELQGALLMFMLRRVTMFDRLEDAAVLFLILVRFELGTYRDNTFESWAFRIIDELFVKFDAFELVSGAVQELIEANDSVKAQLALHILICLVENDPSNSARWLADDNRFLTLIDQAVFNSNQVEFVYLGLSLMIMCLAYCSSIFDCLPVEQWFEMLRNVLIQFAWREPSLTSTALGMCSQFAVVFPEHARYVFSLLMNYIDRGMREGDDSYCYALWKCIDVMMCPPTDEENRRLLQCAGEMMQTTCSAFIPQLVAAVVARQPLCTKHEFLKIVKYMTEACLSSEFRQGERRVFADSWRHLLHVKKHALQEQSVFECVEMMVRSLEDPRNYLLMPACAGALIDACYVPDRRPDAERYLGFLLTQVGKAVSSVDSNPYEVTAAIQALATVAKTHDVWAFFSKLRIPDDSTLETIREYVHLQKSVMKDREAALGFWSIVVNTSLGDASFHGYSWRNLYSEMIHLARKALRFLTDAEAPQAAQIAQHVIQKFAEDPLFETDAACRFLQEYMSWELADEQVLVGIFETLMQMLRVRGPGYTYEIINVLLHVSYSENSQSQSIREALVSHFDAFWQLLSELGEGIFASETRPCLASLVLHLDMQRSVRLPEEDVVRLLSMRHERGENFPRLHLKVLSERFQADISDQMRRALCEQVYFYAGSRIVCQGHRTARQLEFRTLLSRLIDTAAGADHGWEILKTKFIAYTETVCREIVVVTKGKKAAARQ